MNNAGDDIQRGFHSTVANWQLTLIGVAFQWLLGIVLVVSLVIALIPLIVAGILTASMLSGKWAEANLENFILQHPLIAIYILAVISVVLIPLMIIYAFGQAGRCGIFIEAERVAKVTSTMPPYQRWSAFDFSKWAAYGQRFWWRVFLIYNIVWGVYSLLMIAIVAVAAAVVWYFLDRGADAVVAGCASAGIGATLLVIAAFLTAIWSQTAVIECVRRDAGAAAASRSGLAIARQRFGRLLLLQVLMLGVSVAVTGAMFVVFSTMAMLDLVPGLVLLLLPAKVVGSLVQSALGAILGNWYNAAFVSAVEDEAAMVTT